MTLPALFNPSNDMALAANVRQYFPPRHIQQMEDDLSSLSRFWDEGPWGWSLATRQRYLKMGIDAKELPSDEWLEEHRRLSGREFGVEYYRRMTDPKEGLQIPAEGCKDSSARTLDGSLIPCRARYCTSFEEVEQLFISSTLSTRGREGVGTLILKAPWSSSGRGNIIVGGEIHGSHKSRIEHILREQGGIVAEPFYEGKVLDFAMEFWVNDGETRFRGYSVFETDEMGHYCGNYVESQTNLLQRIGLSDEMLRQLVDYHCRCLSRLSYRGPVGIDMMKLRDGRVHPCVEMNFRMNMGIMAILLYEKGVTADQYLTPRRQHGFAAQIRGGRLVVTCEK